MKLTTPETGTFTEELEAVGIMSKIYPNPSTGRLQIEYTSGTTVGARLELIDYTGKVIRILYDGLISGEYRQSYDLNLPSGMYILKLVAGDHQEVEKILFMK